MLCCYKTTVFLKTFVTQHDTATTTAVQKHKKKTTKLQFRRLEGCTQGEYEEIYTPKLPKVELTTNAQYDANLVNESLTMENTSFEKQCQHLQSALESASMQLKTAEEKAASLQHELERVAEIANGSEQKLEEQRKKIANLEAERAITSKENMRNSTKCTRRMWSRLWSFRVGWHSPKLPVRNWKRMRTNSDVKPVRQQSAPPAAGEGD